MEQSSDLLRAVAVTPPYTPYSANVPDYAVPLTQTDLQSLALIPVPPCFWACECRCSKHFDRFQAEKWVNICKTSSLALCTAA
jgi:hypothetical protein